MTTTMEEGLGQLVDRWARETREADDFYDSPRWHRAKGEWVLLVAQSKCFFCLIPFVEGETIVPHHLSLHLSDHGYLPLAGNPDVVPAHPECHGQHHGKMDEKEFRRARAVTLKRLEDTFRGWVGARDKPPQCFGCGEMVFGKRPPGGEYRCDRCLKKHKQTSREKGVCWNCGWYATEEHGGKGGLCRMCHAVGGDENSFGRQRAIRDGRDGW